MCGLCRLGLTAAVVLALAQPAPAQRFGGGGGMMANPLMLLQNPGVQKEIKLTEDQVTKAREVGMEMFQKFQEENQKVQEADEADRPAKRQAMMKKLQEEAEKAMKGLELKPEQEKRLKEITRQVQGPRAFADPEVQKSLKLTGEQKDKIKTITDDLNKETREIFQNAAGDFQGAQQKIRELNKETMEKVAALLKDDQKKSWKEMTGKPFNFQFAPPGQQRRQNP